MNRRSTLHTPFNGSTTGLSCISISCSLTCFLFVCLFLPRDVSKRYIIACIFFVPSDVSVCGGVPEPIPSS